MLNRVHLLLSCAGLVLAIAAPAPARADRGVPRYDHVVLVIMENHSAAQIVGSASAPYINNTLIPAGARMSNSTGVTHPSQPNYIALFSGSTQGSTNDNCPLNFAGVDNLGSQLIAGGFSFTGYSELLPAAGSIACSAGTAPHTYQRKHNPWVDFDNVPAASNQPFSAFAADLAMQLPTVSILVPDQCNDMHDCSVATGDAWLQANLPAFLADAQATNTLLILTWDENDGSAGNQILTVFVGPGVIAGYTDPSTTDHYRVLATLEAMYGLPALGEAANRAPVTAIWNPVFNDGFE